MGKVVTQPKVVRRPKGVKPTPAVFTYHTTGKDVASGYFMRVEG